MTRHTFTPKEASVIRSALVAAHGFCADPGDSDIIASLIKEFDPKVVAAPLLPKVGDTVRWRGMRGFKDSFARGGVRFEQSLFEGVVIGNATSQEIWYIDVDLGPAWTNQRYVTIPASQITEIVSNG